MLDRLLRESHPEAGGFKHNYQSVRVVDRLEKRYEEPGLNLTHDVREGVLKHTAWPRDFPFPLDFPEGLRLESGGSLEAQLVNWSDEIAQQTHDLEDGLPLTEENAIEELAISRQVRAARGYGSDPAARRASLIRGMIGALSADLVEGSRAPHRALARVERVSRRPTSSTPAATASPATSSAFTDAGKRLYAELREFVYRHIIHSFPVSRHDGHARRVLAGLFARLPRQPAPAAGRRSPRASSASSACAFCGRSRSARSSGEVAEHYRSRPDFYRAIADHMAGMTDSYCNSEYRQLVVE